MGENMHFFETIRKQYGKDIVQAMKLFSKTYNKLVNLRNRRNFLLRCRTEDIIPSFLNFKANHLNFYTTDNRQKFEKNVLLKFKVSSLNLLISDVIKQIKILEQDLGKFKQNIYNSIQENISNEFFRRQLAKYENLHNKIKNINIKKFERLLKNQQNTNNTVNIPVEDTWLENISNTPLPNYVKDILSLGPDFSMPIDESRGIPIPNIIANIETSINNLSTDKKDEIRATCCNIITNYKNHPPKAKNEKIQKKFE